MRHRLRLLPPRPPTGRAKLICAWLPSQEIIYVSDLQTLTSLSQSAGDPHHLSADLVRLRLQQEFDQRGDVVRTRHPPQRYPRDLAVDKFMAENLAHPLGIDRARRDHVDADAVAAEAARERAGEPDDGGLGSVIGGVPHMVEIAE